MLFVPNKSHDKLLNRNIIKLPIIKQWSSMWASSKPNEEIVVVGQELDP